MEMNFQNGLFVCSIDMVELVNDVTDVVNGDLFSSGYNYWIGNIQEMMINSSCLK